MTRKKSSKVPPSSRGFTLIEMAIVMAITATLLVATVAAVQSWMKQSSLSASQQRLAEIQQAITNFKAQNRRLPCPSSFTAVTGRESTSCTGALVGGTFAAIGRSGSTDLFGGTPVVNPPVIIGSLPVRDLGLPDSYRVNYSGYAYTYAITRSTATAPMNSFAGAIDVVDGFGNTVLPIAADNVSRGTATYVVVDPGKDGKGAYTSNGILASACGSAAGLDQFNCNYSGANPIRFRSAPYGNRPGANWFDDSITYNTNLSVSTRTCTTVYSATTAAGTPVVPGTSFGYDHKGYDSGGGFTVGFIAFVFFYANTLTFGVDTLVPLYNTVSPTSVAYCPANYRVVSGGCTQTRGAPLSTGGGAMNATGTNGPVATYGYDITQSTHEQLVFPPLSHPAIPNAAGQQGWECNGSSALLMQTQAYVTCCTGR